MCGITAIFRNLALEFASERVARMTRDISHRGPDDEGIIYLSPSNDHWEACQPADGRWRVALGCRRLAIQDLSQAGHMPMLYQERYWIVYNGEIYNFIEIRTTLTKRGYTFRSSSDTEVILAAYAEWGTGCFTRFRGMWSIVIFDSLHNMAIICRDRLGIKPLYLWRGQGIIAITSEIKQMYELPGFTPRLNKTVAMQYLQTGYEDPNACFWQDIQPVPAGTWLTLSMDTLAPSAPQTYWKPQGIQAMITRPEEAALLFAEKLQECIHLYLRSDVPVGCALSGGLDSSTIAVIIDAMAGNQEQPLHTFTATFLDNRVDERPYVDHVLSKIRAIPHFVTPDPYMFLEELKQFLYVHDEPVGGLSVYASYCVARMMHEAQVPVTLNGQGCDELLSGYWQSYFLYLWQLSKKGRVLPMVSHLLGAATKEGNPMLLYQVPIMLKRFYIRCNPARFIHLRTKLREMDVERPTLKQVCNMEDRLWRVEEIRTLFLPRLLKWEDRNSMAFSIEGRYPFLDHELVELCLSFATETLYHNGWTKWPLRLGVGSMLPPQIRLRRSKFGFEVPQDTWLSGSLRPALQLWTKQDRPLWGYIEQADVQNLAQQVWRSGHQQSEAGQALFRLFVFDHWLELFRIRG